MKKPLLVILVIIGVMAVLLLGLGIMVGLGQRLAMETIPQRTILEADFETALAEYVPDDPIAAVIMEKTPTVLGVVEALEAASRDDRVVGLFARVGAANLSIAQIQEIRDAVISFRHSGKSAVAYSETFGEAGPGGGAYYLASAFDEIYMQPSGDPGLGGVGGGGPFLPGPPD